jgi:hypothetical protein
MSLAFASGFVRGAAPGLASTVERNETRALRAKVTQAQERYLAEKDRILNVAKNEDWDADKVSTHLSALASNTLADPALQKDELIYAQLEKGINSLTRTASNGYRTRYDGKMEAVRDAEEALGLYRDMSAIAESARTSGVAGEFSGGFVTDPYSTTPDEFLGQVSDYLAGSMAELAKDKSLEGRKKYAKRMLSAEKAIKTIHSSYKQDYITYQNERLDANINASLEQSVVAVEASIRNAFTHLSMPVNEDDPAAQAAMDPRSIVASLNYKMISDLAAQRGKSYFEVADKKSLQEALGSMLALNFLKKNSAPNADTNSTQWRSMVKAIENTQDDEQLSNLFHNVFGDETARFAQGNTTGIISAATRIINEQRPTVAIQEDRYKEAQKASDATTNQTLNNFRRLSVEKLPAEIVAIYETAMLRPDTLMTSSWFDQAVEIFETGLASGVYGPPRLFGDNVRENPDAVKNKQKIEDYVLTRINNTMGIMQYPGRSRDFLRDLPESEQNVLLRDAVSFDKQMSNLNDPNLYAVEEAEFSQGANDALRFIQTRGFAPPAFINFVVNKARELEMVDTSTRAAGQASEDLVTIDFMSQTLNTLLNSPVYRQLPDHQSNALEQVRRQLANERNVASATDPELQPPPARTGR